MIKTAADHVCNGELNCKISTQNVCMQNLFVYVCFYMCVIYDSIYIGHARADLQELAHCNGMHGELECKRMAGELACKS